MSRSKSCIDSSVIAATSAGFMPDCNSFKAIESKVGVPIDRLNRVCLQFYYAGHKQLISCVPLLIYSHVNCAAVLENQMFLLQPSEL